jgi:eukaryotic-like serine/threonine-protein kinase
MARWPVRRSTWRPKRAKARRPIRAWDIYALGVLLYEALTGELPQGAFARLPPAWDRVIRRALAPDPEQRYADVGAFARALRGATASAANDAGGADELSSDELSFMRAVAGMQTVASAVLLWALYLSVTPRVIAREQLEPLIMLAYRALPDGRIASLARFEIGPMLAAVLSAGLAVGCYALLRRHWRYEGLERVLPDQPVPSSSLVLGLGAFNLLGFGARLSAQAAGFGMAVAFVPILGGIAEAVTVYLSWMTCLELWRRRRPLRREWRLWLGLALSAVPPVVELVRYLHGWQP